MVEVCTTYSRLHQHSYRDSEPGITNRDLCLVLYGLFDDFQCLKGRYFEVEVYDCLFHQWFSNLVIKFHTELLLLLLSIHHPLLHILLTYCFRPSMNTIQEYLHPHCPRAQTAPYCMQPVRSHHAVSLSPQLPHSCN
jgi:hypothetical protein